MVSVAHHPGADPLRGRRAEIGASRYGQIEPHATYKYTDRFELHMINSSLFAALCQANSTTGRCHFTSEVKLERTLPCFGIECRVQGARVVKLRNAGTHNNGESYDVYFEYMRPACVELSYYDNPVLVAPRFGFRDGGSFNGSPRTMCANPKSAMAFTACCSNISTTAQRGTCIHEYSWEYVTLATAEARCAAFGEDPGWKTCAKEGQNCHCRDGEIRYGYDDTYAPNWTVARPVVTPHYLMCSNESFGGFVLPDGAAKKCQCRRDLGPMRLCDLTQPAVRIDANGEPGCDISYDRFWSARTPCQMQAQVTREGAVSLVDHIEGPSGYYVGNASMSSQHVPGQTWFAARNAIDGKTHTMVHSVATGEDDPWWQVRFDQPRTISTITVHNRDGMCAARMFAAGGCPWEYSDGSPSFEIFSHVVGFEVGVSNTSCVDDGDPATSGNSCGGSICERVTSPTLAGEGHAYTITCDPPVLGSYAYITLPGTNRILHFTQFEARGPDERQLGRFNDTQFKPDMRERFRVQWNNQIFPRVSDADCSGVCAVHGESCLCNVSVVTEAVFVDNSSLPALAEVVAELHVGATDPSLFDNGTFVRCDSQVCSRSDVAVYWRNSSGSNGELLNTDTIFGVPHGSSASAQMKYFRNVKSVVSLEGGNFSFRNPPSFATRGQFEALRDGENEVDAMLDHYFNHPSTAAFVSTLLIQRTVTSNPSPRFVEAVATAFNTGRYGSHGNGSRGDLAATTAAIFLDREARSGLLEHDPNHGGMREPLLKLTHMLRGLELVTPTNAELVQLRDVLGEHPFQAPSVFNFFQADYQPAGTDIEQAGLVAPEALVLSTPNLISYLNAVFTTVKLGITACDGGVGANAMRAGPIYSCHYAKNPEYADLMFGNLSFTPGGAGVTLVNPSEQARRYSSVYANSAPGTGYCRSMLGSMAAWNAAAAAAGEWMEMDLGEVRNVTGVVTQGRNGHLQYVECFTVEYSADGTNYERVHQGEMFCPSNGTGTSYFGERVAARHIRIIVGISNHAAMRAGVLVAPDSVPAIANFTHFIANASNASEVVAELDVVLTGGRLSPYNRAIVEDSFDAAVFAEGHAAAGLKQAEMLLLASPEFQLTGGSPSTAMPVPLPSRVRNMTLNDPPLPYKAVVYFFLCVSAFLAPFRAPLLHGSSTCFGSLPLSMHLPLAPLSPPGPTLTSRLVWRFL